LGDLPLLGRLFGAQKDDKTKNEIILSITPRIVRSNRQADGDLLEMWSGTENNLRYGSKVVGSNTKNQPAASAAPAAPAAAPTAAAATPPGRVVPPRAATGTAPAPALAPSPASAAAAATRAAVPGVPPAASAAALRPVGLAAPKSAKPGEQISVALALPAMTGAGSFQMTLAFDPDRLRLLAVNEAAPERNATAAAHFTGEADGPGSVRIELAAGRGESLPAAGGALAELQFEVLAVPGTTQLSVSNSSLQMADGAELTLPASAPVGLEIKATQ
jgi:general secretion pathway protein D